MRELGYIPQEGDHHTLEYLRALGRALDRAGVPASGPSSRGGRVSWNLMRLGLERNYVRGRGRALIVGMPWPSNPSPFPRQYWTEVVPFLSDCWPAHYDAWARRLRRLRVRHVFVVGKESAAELQKRLPETRVHWMPEGINPDEWIAGPPLAERELDVLELGRHHPPYHERITGELGPDVSHRFAERGTETPIFRGDAALKQGLAAAKIQICFPKSMTHPELGPTGGVGAGSLEVLSQRYLEAMVSGSVIVGHAPRDLVELIGVDPVVEADMDDPAGQLQSILERIEEYQELVDRNRELAAQYCSWDVRVSEKLATLEADGYGVPQNAAG